MRIPARNTCLFATLTALVAAGGSLAGDAAPENPAAQTFEVHGDWVVTVLDADGSVASRHAFANALVDDGKEILVTLLGGQANATLDAGGEPVWALAVGAAGIIDGADCADTANPPAEENSPGRATVTPTADASTGTFSLVLTRNLTLPASCLRPNLTFWEVTEVGARLSRTPVGGGSPVSALFASKSLSPAIQVLPDQSVFLEATYTFD